MDMDIQKAQVNTLISLLGKSNLDSKTGYRVTCYRMPNGEERSTEYFGLALAEYLQVRRMILIGTASSMWDLLVENVAGDDAAEELRIMLFDAVRAGTVSEDLLGKLAPAIEQKVGRKVTPLVISSSVTFAEQQALLFRLEELLQKDERVALDLTHGFRHLAMLGLAASRYLSHERGVQVVGLYYGALDMTRDGITPVVTVDGLAHLLEWAEAFEGYDASGDFSRFAPLLKRDGLAHEAADALERAWGLLQVSNVSDAARTLYSAWKKLESPLTGASELFRKRLQKALRWCQAQQLSEKLRLLALQSLGRGDVLRAAVFGFECTLVREVEEAGGNPLDYEQRKAADDRLQEAFKGGEEGPDWKRHAYWLLKNVRNACAHSAPPRNTKHAELMRNPERLRRELDATLNRLTNT
ncbi:hypothetical protein TDMWS_05060 [Thermodesulfomicrobium sp. WS]|uniref:TIGR02221 family CRISPR-associated protein n=1 Tax=Thermodesulfomicrobium sp. WS TaxID=3004129 RepID=UPI0024918C72|nr:TIGR02221 family CRISPR-associated protein [Thermodesulfomicrobium sp. WS]BDV00421.1 hypothetical protein TDMWS_05060 [Thermodesulfomicrobium sp. WS]